jgi:hypothetical protein
MGMPTSHRKGPAPLESSSADDRAAATRTAPDAPPPAGPRAAPREIGGRPGPDPTRFGDWEKNGRCIDF